MTDMASMTTSAQQQNVSTSTVLNPQQPNDSATNAATGPGQDAQATGHQNADGEQETGQHDDDQDEEGDKSEDRLESCEHRDEPCEFCQGYMDGHWMLEDFSPDTWCKCDNCWDDMVEEYPELELSPYDRPGYMHGHLEYLHKDDPYPGCAAIYDDSSARELRRFVLARGLIDPFPNGLTLRYYYARVLEKADRERTFRFMDLPPEMRNEVYRSLLLLRCNGRGDPRHKQSSFPEILCASKEIYKEGVGILYGENVINYDSNVIMHQGHAVTATTRLNGARKSQVFGQQIPNSIDDYPAYLRRIQHLKITINYEIEGPGYAIKCSCHIPGNLLATLASFLMDDHSLKTLHLDIPKFDRERDPWTLGTALYGLRRLRNIPNIKITGAVPDSMAKIMTREMSSSQPSFNTMKHWKLITAEARQIVTFVEHTMLDLSDGYGTCCCGDCWGDGRRPPLYEKILQLQDEIDEESIGAFGFASQETKKQSLLYELQGVIDEANTDRLKETLKKIEQARSARESYSAAETSDQLEDAYLQIEQDPDAELPEFEEWEAAAREDPEPSAKVLTPTH